MSNIFVYGLHLPLYIMFVDDIAIQKGKLFGIIWLVREMYDISRNIGY